MTTLIIQSRFDDLGTKKSVKRRVMSLLCMFEGNILYADWAIQTEPKMRTTISDLFRCLRFWTEEPFYKSSIVTNVQSDYALPGQALSQTLCENTLL